MLGNGITSRDNPGKDDTMSKKHEALVPVSTTRIDPVIVPEHKVESTLTGKVEIDQQSKLVDGRTCKEIFLSGMASGLFDECKNAAQVNNKIAEIRNNGKPAPYMVSEVSHAWERVDGKWAMKSADWLAANPFTPGVGHSRENYKGRLSDVDFAALQAQRDALQVLASNPAIVPLLSAIEGKLKDHETACQLEAIGQAAIRRRKSIMEKVEDGLRNWDKAGHAYPMIIRIDGDGCVNVNG